MTNWTHIKGAERTSEREESALGPVDRDLRVSVTLILCRGEGGDARPDDIERVRTFARERGLAVTFAHPERRTVGLSGTASAIASAFNVELVMHNDLQFGPFLAPAGPVQVPEFIGSAVSMVVGLNSELAAVPQATFVPPHAGAEPLEFPDPGPAGVTIGIIALGAGWNRTVLEADLATQRAAGD